MRFQFWNAKRRSRDTRVYHACQMHIRGGPCILYGKPHGLYFPAENCIQAEDGSSLVLSVDSCDVRGLVVAVIGPPHGITNMSLLRG